MDQNSPQPTSPVPSTSITVEQALTYLHQGWSVIPVILQSNHEGKISKRPAVRWQIYQQQRPSQQEIQQWFSAKKYNGIGVVTGRISGLIVVDIEREAMPEDVKVFESSLESHTISGGRHVFYRWTKPVDNAVRLGGKPIDVRGDGGFVVLPPSQLGSQGYVWLKKAAPQSLQAMPHHVEEMVTRSTIQPAQKRLSQSDMQYSRSQMSIYPMAKVGERNATAAKVSGSLCANIAPKLWEVAGWPALIQWNQTRCVPPLALLELQQVWNSITAIHQRNHPGQLLHSKQSKHIPSEPAPLISWKEFSTLQFKEPEWIIDSLIPHHGLVALAGPPESGKSYFTTCLSVSVARGQRLFDQFATKRTPVLLIDQENLPVWIQHRLTQFQAEPDLPLHIYANRSTPFNLEDKTAFLKISNYIDTHQIGLVVLDTLRLSHNRDENSSTDMKPVFERLKALTKKTAVLFIQHHRKMDRSQRDKVHGEDMMGSMLIRGSVDYQLSIIKLSDVADSITQIKVSQTKARYTRNLPPFTLTLEESADGLAFVYQGVTPQADLKLTSAKQAILALLSSQPMTRQVLMDRLTSDAICSIRTGDEALKRLKETGVVMRDDNKPHVYALTHTATNGLQTCKTPALQPANVNHQGRENGVIHNGSAQPTQPQEKTLQDRNIYKEMQPATSDLTQRENRDFHHITSTRVEDGKAQRQQAVAYDNNMGEDTRHQLWNEQTPPVLTYHQLPIRITKLKRWLLSHQRRSLAQPPLATNGQPYKFAQWQHVLEHYCLLIDVAQDQGTAYDDDWLEMARMIFHTNEGMTGHWLLRNNR